MTFKILLILCEILRNLAIFLLVILNYSPTKNIIKNQFKSEINKFHKNYLYNNYQLNAINLNEFDSINEALSLINDNPEDFVNIPSEEIYFANLYMIAINNYKRCSINTIKFILLIITIDIAIKFGLSF